MGDKMFDTVVRKYASWVNYRRTVGELSRLSNRQLGDLGIERRNIRSVARNGK